MNSNWSYGPETAKLGVDLCDLDLWPWPFAWTSLLSLVITPENFMMLRWWEHSQKGVTDRQTDGRTDGKYHSLSCLVAAKNYAQCIMYICGNILQYINERHWNFHEMCSVLRSTSSWNFSIIFQCMIEILSKVNLQNVCIFLVELLSRIQWGGKLALEINTVLLAWTIMATLIISTSYQHDLLLG